MSERTRDAGDLGCGDGLAAGAKIVGAAAMVEEIVNGAKSVAFA